MILQIRTKDNLETLLAQSNSPAWVIAEERVPEIKSVEIYQFDGKKVLKADFDAAKSTRTDSGRLVVAFTNGVIEDANHDWNGQNPVRYIQENEIENSKEENLYSNFQYYSKIKNAISKDDETLSVVLKEVYDEFNGAMPCISIEWTGDGSQMEQKAIVSEKDLELLLSSLEETVADSIRKITGAVNQEFGDYRITQKEVYQIIELLQDNEYLIFCSIKPQEWNNVLFVYKKIEEIEPLMLLNHFKETKDSAEGWFDEFFADFDKNADQYKKDSFSHLEKYHNDNTVLKYSIEQSEDFLGNTVENFRSNFEILNLNDTTYKMCVKGIKAAEKYCKE